MSPGNPTGTSQANPKSYFRKPADGGSKLARWLTRSRRVVPRYGNRVPTAAYTWQRSDDNRPAQQNARRGLLLVDFTCTDTARSHSVTVRRTF